MCPEWATNVVSIALTVFDISSDIALGIDYCSTDNPWWCGLTWTFIAVPLLLGRVHSAVRVVRTCLPLLGER